MVEAIARHERALAGFERILGPTHPYTLMAINKTALLLTDPGKLEDAKVLFDQASSANCGKVRNEVANDLSRKSFELESKF